MLANNKTSKTLKHFFIGHSIRTTSQNKTALYNIKCGQYFIIFLRISANWFLNPVHYPLEVLPDSPISASVPHSV